MRGLEDGDGGWLKRRSVNKGWLFALLAAALVSFYFLIPEGTDVIPVTPSFHADLQQCKRDTIRAKPIFPDSKRINARAAEHDAFIVRNARLIDGDGEDQGLKDILIVNGTVIKTAKTITGWSGIEYDAGKRYVTPGVIDMHSHLGGRGLPQFKANEDVSEVSSPYLPHMRAVDAFDPSDDSRERVVSGGITSALILTGASQLISGQGMSIKLRLFPDLSVDKMQIEANDHLDRPQRYIKHACGENPKVLGNPKTRLGEAAYFREAYWRAKRLLDEQDDWCSLATHGQAMRQRYPQDPVLQPLVDVLRGDVSPHIHCYKTGDIEAMLRLAEEFKFDIKALHHASETWRMIDRLKPNHQNTTIAIFAAEQGFKPEAMHASVNNAAMMEEAGFPVAMHTDHPAINGQYPAREAGVMHNFGLSTQGALASMFAVPAKAMGLDHRIGYLRPGYDADLVVWDDHPLQLGAAPLQVWIDGEAQLSGGGSDQASVSWKKARLGREAPLQRGQVVEEDHAKLHLTTELSSGDMILHDVNTRFHPMGTSAKTSVVISAGKIACIGDCYEHASAAKNVEIDDAYLMPGLVSLSPMSGLTEMLMDDSTTDGYVNPTDPHATHAQFGVAAGMMHVKHAQANGISVLVTPPRAAGPKVLERWGTGGFIKGVSTAFYTGAEHAADGEVYLKRDVAYHVSLGPAAISSGMPTISGQVQALRHLISEPIDEDWQKVNNGTLPLVVHVESADAIAQLVFLKKDMPDTKVIVLGGSEAWMVADELAEAEIPVILAPWRSMPLTWEFRRAHLQNPLTDETSVQVLLKAGVNVGVQAGDDRHVRDMWWEAAWASQAPSRALPEFADADRLAMDLLNNNVMDILGLELDTSRAFSIWQRNPLDYGAIPAMIFGREKLERYYPTFD